MTTYDDYYSIINKSIKKKKKLGVIKRTKNIGAKLLNYLNLN